MAENWKRLLPALNALDAQLSLEEALDEAAQGDGDVKGYCFTAETIGVLEGKTLDVSGCRFERCVFSELDFSRLSFVDCVFEKCELSNVRLNSAAFQRVEFINCRMTGMEIMRGALMSVLFSGCMMDYLTGAASFDDCYTKLENQIRRYLQE